MTRVEPTDADDVDVDRAAATWLSMLAARAPRTDLDEFGTLVLGGADEGRRAELGLMAEEVRSISDLLVEQRSATMELTALNTLARRLASLHDTNDVLQEIAVQARQLLGTHVAYIMLGDDDQKLTIQFIDGSLGSALAGSVLQRGEGLGGEVMRTGQPLCSEIYLSDARLQRVRAVDEAATSEQLGGIVGVPLQVGSDTLGVLCAADRRPRRFSDKEIELLAGLASHAAVALRNASLFESLGRAMVQLRQTVAELERTNDERQRSIDLRETLSGLVIGGHGTQEIVHAVSLSADVPVALLNAAGAVLCSSRLDVQLGITLDELWFARARTKVAEAPQHVVTATVIPMREGYAGCLASATAAPLAEDTIRLLEIAATSVALVMSSQRNVAEAELRLRGELLSALLASRIDESSLRRRAAGTGVDLDAVRSIAVFAAPAGHERDAAGLASKVAKAVDGWVADYAGLAVMLIPTRAPADVRRLVLERYGPTLPAAVGIAASTGAVTATREGYESARRTTMLLQALGRERTCALASEMGTYSSLFQHSGRAELAAFVEAQLGPLLRHDDRRSSDLVDTVETYLAKAQHHTTTAAALHVHTNTLYNRLDRINDLLGDDWRTADRAFDLQLALRFRHLMHALPDSV